MGISINLYRISKAEKIIDVKDLEKELENAKKTKVNLYKMTQDLALIFLNNIDPFEDTTTIPYKMLYGNYADHKVGWIVIGGFIPTSEIEAIVDWITKSKVDNWDAFATMYDNLSVEVKQELDDIGITGDKEELKWELFDPYVKPLIDFYKEAKVSNNSIVIIGE